MLGGQGGCHPLPGLLAALAAAAHLGKEHVHHKQLGQPGGYALRTSLAPEALEPFLAQMRAHTDVPVRIS